MLVALTRTTQHQSTMMWHPLGTRYGNAKAACFLPPPGVGESREWRASFSRRLHDNSLDKTSDRFLQDRAVRVVLKYLYSVVHFTIFGLFAKVSYGFVFNGRGNGK